MFFRYTLFGSPGGGLWQFELAAGLFLVAAGILIALFPEILVALIATILVFTGLGFIGAAWRTRRFLRARRPDEFDIIDM